MCKPILREDGRWYVRFYSVDRWPWYQASIVVSNRIEAYKEFHNFVDDCKADRKERRRGR